ncbi:membrane protein insertase YidC [Ramlibacter tataouinensis]|uniref:Membrane protein insertase YidC n=1 Tax=Ramlibacter tataouinensis (strain ATCC BAA-407 / DSM 14655 / LMG 21543 / TTB310) TaxID=365046 RepID=F5Y357_RAMTT|nr:membrane protein insertase YidC [Ramlibacter tataouinensis]AEG94937.1 Candidate preprotein translocase subunit [Ramlibacter tataouinensis TTB310]
MNDIRRTILWVIFGFSMVLLWDQWQVHNGRQATFFPKPTPPAATAPAPAGGTPGAVPVPAPAAAQAPGAGAAPPGAAAPAPAAPREQVTVTTDVMRITFDTQGGSIVRTELLQHASDSVADKKAGNFVLLEQSPERVHVAQSGLVGGDLPNHLTPMTFSGERELKDGANQLVARFESVPQGGVKLVKTYTLTRGNYDVPVRHEVINQGTAPVSPQLYVQLVRGAGSSGGSFLTNPAGTFTGPAVYTEAQKYQKVEFEEIDKNKAEFQKEATSGWVAMVQHYFASAWILPEGTARENFVRKLDNSLYAVGMITPPQPVAPGAAQVVEAKFFAGPQEEKMLERVAPGLDLVKDYGIFTILAKPLYWLLDKLHSVLGNWGWSIVALVLVIKIAFYWLQAKGYESMAKMKAINPRVMQLRERYKDNPQQMQQEMMRIYREEKVNPLGGCLPILVQIPVFIALYWVLLSSVEMRNAPWIGWIRDLSSPDPYFILPVVMTLTTLLQTALNPAPPDPMQARLMWFMPLIFSVMFFFFPAGLVLYWITNNVLSIAQQWLINTRMGVPPEFNLPKFGGS